MGLVPCPACSRHLRVSSTSCPFCRALMPEDLATRVLPAPSGRLDRLAAMTFAASLAVSTAAACTPSSGGAVDPPPPKPAPEPTSMAAAYGAPAPPELLEPRGAVDAGTVAPPPPPSAPPAPPAKPSATPAKPQSTDRGAAAPAYGMPPPHTRPPQSPSR